jgi:hypothetical protein
VNALSHYLKQIVEPTFDDFARNPGSARHAYLACVAAYHAVDRVTYPRKPRNLNKKWGSECFQFIIIDMVAHHFKHVVSDIEKAPAKKGHIPLSCLVFGGGTPNSYGLNERALNEGGLELRNLYFVIRDAMVFLHKKAAELA